MNNKYLGCNVPCEPILVTMTAVQKSPEGSLQAHCRLIAVSFVTLSFDEIKSEIHKLNFYGCSFSNLGNTCYMNAILQSLLGLPPFVQDLSNRALLENVLPHCLYK